MCFSHALSWVVLAGKQVPVYPSPLESTGWLWMSTLTSEIPFPCEAGVLSCRSELRY